MNVDDHLHIQIHDKVPVVTEPVYFRQPRNAQTTLTIQFIWCQHCQVLYSGKLLIPRATFHPKEIQRILHWVTISIIHLGKTLLTTNIFLFLENLILRILSATGFCRGGCQDQRSVRKFYLYMKHIQYSITQYILHDK